jgi:hypothetical protein
MFVEGNARSDLLLFLLRNYVFILMIVVYLSDIYITFPRTKHRKEILWNTSHIIFDSPPEMSLRLPT